MLGRARELSTPGDYGRVTIRVGMPLLAPLIHMALAVWVAV